MKSFWRRKKCDIDEVNNFVSTDSTIGECLLDLFQLSANHRTVLHLYYYEDYKTSEIALLLNEKESTVASQLSRARKQLKIEMEAELHDKARIN